MPYILWHYVLNYNIDVLCSFLSCTYASFKFHQFQEFTISVCFFSSRGQWGSKQHWTKKIHFVWTKTFHKIYFFVFYGRKKMGLGLEMHEGKYMITGFSFLGKLSPSQQCSTLVNSQCR